MAKLGDGSLPSKTTPTNDFRLLVHDPAAPSDKDGEMTRENLLSGVAMNGGDHDFGTSEIDDLTATDASVTNLTVVTGLQFDTGATISECIVASASVTAPLIASGAGANVTATVTGVAAGDFMSVGFTAALPDGLMVQTYISAADTVTFRFYNATGASIASDTYTAKIMVFRAS